MPNPARCYSCRNPLPEGAARCPDCGAPVAAPKRAARSQRPLLVGFMLLSLALVAAFQGLVVLSDPGGALRYDFPLPGSEPQVQGVVLDAQGNPASNVTVSRASDPNATSVSDAAGAYRMGNLSGGYAELLFTRGAEGPVRLRLFLVHDEQADVRLGSMGAPEQTVRHASLDRMETVLGILRVVLVVLALVAVAGAVAAFRRGPWALALAGAIASLGAYLPLSILLGGIAIVLVVASRREFRPRNLPPRPEAAPPSETAPKPPPT